MKPSELVKQVTSLLENVKPGRSSEQPILAAIEVLSKGLMLAEEELDRKDALLTAGNHQISELTDQLERVNYRLAEKDEMIEEFKRAIDSMDCPVHRRRISELEEEIERLKIDSVMVEVDGGLKIAERYQKKITQFKKENSELLEFCKAITKENILLEMRLKREEK